jgi:hypothetical protein
MKAILLFTVIFFLFSCSESDGDTGPDYEPDHSTESTDSLNDILSEEIEDFPEQMPEGFSGLIALFDDKSNDIDDSYIQMLGADPSDASIMPFQTSDYYQLDAGTVFHYWTSGGATDTYIFQLVGLSYFNEAGELINTASVGTTDQYSISVIQDFVIHIENSYPEYVEGEIVMEETGKTITDHYYFVIDESLTKIEDAEKSKLPYYRNQLFAKHGYIFKTQKYTNHFSQFDWYEPRFENVDDQLTEEEKLLADYLKQLEEK